MRYIMTRNGPGCHYIRILYGAYILGGLQGHDETPIRTHLARCARCRADHEELAELPSLEDLINRAEAADTETAPEAE